MSEDKNDSFLEPFFNPRSIAVIGASKNPVKIGGRPVNRLLAAGYKGKIYPVNPSHDIIEGLKCYHSLQEIPDQIDLAVISVAAGMLYGILEECALKGIKGAVVYSSGFAETGAEGRREQKRIAELAKKTGLRILGPNCMGVINSLNGVFTSFAPFIEDPFPEAEKITGFVTQSGAYGTIIYQNSLQRGVGFNYFVSVGNEADLDITDFLEYMVHDPQTKIAGAYLEEVKNGAKLRRVAKEALERKKPILVMKVGRSEAGKRAATSHTGSLAGSDRVYDAFFRQTGMIRIDNYTEIISFVNLFQTGKMPQGNNVAVIVNSGGSGIYISDLCESLGLNVVSLSDKTRSQLGSLLPAFGSSTNPVDLTSMQTVQQETVPLVLEVLVKDPDVDIIVINTYFPNLSADHPVIRRIIEICKESEKLIVFIPFDFHRPEFYDASSVFRHNGIPVIEIISEAVKAIANIVNYCAMIKKRKPSRYRVIPSYVPKPDLGEILGRGGPLSESRAKAVLELYGIPIARQELALTADEAVRQAQKIGYPVVLKINSPDIPHKTEAGGLKLNLSSDREVRSAFNEILSNAGAFCPGARINGVCVQEMLPPGVEVIIGVSMDPSFGPVIMFGLGGIFVEVLEDVSFRVAPVSPGDAYDMIAEVKGYTVLKGIRGNPPADLEAIVDVILKVSALVTDYRDSIKELDINPLIVYQKGIRAADAMLVLNT